MTGFAQAARDIRDGGREIGAAGGRLVQELEGLPVVGAQVGQAARQGVGEVGRTVIERGTELYGLVLMLAVVLAVIVLAIPLLPWLLKYLPWRWERLQRLRAAHRAIRRAPDISEPQVERLLASRAVYRLPWDVLLEYTPDPLGDWASGRHDRLARAELASAGLRPR